jgi:hypothetical protein
LRGGVLLPPPFPRPEPELPELVEASGVSGDVPPVGVAAPPPPQVRAVFVQSMVSPDWEHRSSAASFAQV